MLDHQTLRKRFTIKFDGVYTDPDGDWRVGHGVNFVPGALSLQDHVVSAVADGWLRIKLRGAF